MGQNDYSEFQARMNALMMVVKINNPEKYEDLVSKIGFWPPEAGPVNYTNWVKDNYDINPNDLVALNVYSILMNMPIEVLQKKMIKDLLDANYQGKHDAEKESNLGKLIKAYKTTETIFEQRGYGIGRVDLIRYLKTGDLKVFTSTNKARESMKDVDYNEITKEVQCALLDSAIAEISLFGYAKSKIADIIVKWAQNKISAKTDTSFDYIYYAIILNSQKNAEIFKYLLNSYTNNNQMVYNNGSYRDTELVKFLISEKENLSYILQVDNKKVL